MFFLKWDQEKQDSGKEQTKGQIRISNFEARNKFKIQNSNDQNNAGRFSAGFRFDIGHLNFVLVSNFRFRIWCLNLDLVGDGSASLSSTDRESEDVLLDVGNDSSGFLESLLFDLSLGEKA